MEPELKFVVWLIACVLFAVAAADPPRGRLIPLGLALFVLPFVWDAGELAWG